MVGEWDGLSWSEKEVAMLRKMIVMIKPMGVSIMYEKVLRTLLAIKVGSSIVRLMFL